MANERRLMLIDLTAVRAEFNKEYNVTMGLVENGDTELDNLAEGFFEAVGVLEQQGVDVITCENCKFYEKVSYVNTGGICQYWDCGDSEYPNAAKPDDFCSYGEKREVE